MAKMTTDELLGVFEEMTVLELKEFLDAFEEKFDANIDFISVDSAATLLTKIILEGSSTKADIVLGLDMNLFDAANKSNLFSNHKVGNINEKIQLPIKLHTQQTLTHCNSSRNYIVASVLEPAFD